MAYWQWCLLLLVLLSNLCCLSPQSFRGFLYKQEELWEVDEKIYQWYLKDGSSMKALMAATAHDFSIQDALFDYLEGKTAIAIMGGHSMSRGADSFKNVARLAQRLAKSGFLVVTGGGPGAMEAANLGAYMRQRTEDELEDALETLGGPGAGNDAFEHEYNNSAPAMQVLTKYGMPDRMPSLGIPTWRYGHEPSNRFASWHAKMFSNAVREDGIISIANAGVIFTPGSAGTRQEVFQDALVTHFSVVKKLNDLSLISRWTACRNHYAAANIACPMVFYGTQFWKECGVFDVLKNTSSGRPYHDLLLSSDSIDDIVTHYEKYRETRGLPVITDEHLMSDHWIRPTLLQGCEGTPQMASTECLFDLMKQ